MTISDTLHTWARSAAYWIRWTLLEMYGPATQDAETDPVERLKREYGRPELGDRWRRQHL